VCDPRVLGHGHGLGPDHGGLTMPIYDTRSTSAEVADARGGYATLGARLELIGEVAYDAKPTGNGAAGHPFDWRHNDASGYLLHLASGAAMSGGAMVGIGIGDSGNVSTAIAGLLVSNKSKGRGIILDNLQTVTSDTAYGMHGRQDAMSPLIYLERRLGGTAPILRIEDNASPGPGADEVLQDWRGSGSVLMGKVVTDAAEPNKLNFAWSGGAIIGSEFRGLPVRVGDTLSNTGSYVNSIKVYNAADAVMIFNTVQFGGATGGYTFKIADVEKVRINYQGNLSIAGKLGVGNSAAATTPGSVTKKIQVMAADGTTSLGYLAVYDAIT
jgi:hypothetical protein